MDVNADGDVNAADALDVINYLNSRISPGRAESEAAPTTFIQAALADELFSLSAAQFSFSSDTTTLPIPARAAKQLGDDHPWPGIQHESRDSSAFSTPNSPADPPSLDLFEEWLLDLPFVLESPLLADLLA